MDCQLKKAVQNDYNFIYDLKKSSVYNYVNDIWGWDEIIQKDFFDKDFMNIQEFKVITYDNSDIGFTQIFENDNLINITEIHLLPQYQGNGIGTDIIKNIIHSGIQKNKLITLGCFKNNIKAKNLYIKLGFDLIKETPTHFLLEYTAK